MPICRYYIGDKVVVRGDGRCVITWTYSDSTGDECEYDVTTENGTAVRIKESDITNTWW